MKYIFVIFAMDILICVTNLTFAQNSPEKYDRVNLPGLTSGEISSRVSGAEGEAPTEKPLEGALPAPIIDVTQKKKDLESLAQEIKKNASMELHSLEIKARIHEPSVIYILDRPKVDVEIQEPEVSFSSRIFTPLYDKKF